MVPKWRIGTSVLFGALTIALAVLWLRSYWRIDHSVSYGCLWNHWGAGFYSIRGSTTLFFNHPDVTWMVDFGSHLAAERGVNLNVRPDRNAHFAHQVDPYSVTVRTPYWLWVAASVVLASIPWMTCAWKRFSLRMLLIVTTLSCGALGLGVWLAS